MTNKNKSNKLRQQAAPIITLDKIMIDNPNTSDLRKQIYDNMFLVLHEKYKLSSGKSSQYYFDIRKYSTTWNVNILIGIAYTDIMLELENRLGPKDFPLLRVGGLETGALPIITAVIREYELMGFYVRKEPKKYGMKQQLEGNLENVVHVILVDDIVTTGKSMIKCIDAIKKYGHLIKIIGVYPLIDRNKELENYDLFFQLKSRDIEYKPIFHSTEFIDKYNYERMRDSSI